jgi:entericidin B
VQILVAETKTQYNRKGSIMKIALAALFAATMISLTGCNTVEGAGKDVKAAGQAVEKTADKSKPY